MSPLWRVKAWKGSQSFDLFQAFPIFSFIQTCLNEGKTVSKQLKLNKMKQSLKQNLADTVWKKKKEKKKEAISLFSFLKVLLFGRWELKPRTEVQISLNYLNGSVCCCCVTCAHTACYDVPQPNQSFLFPEFYMRFTYQHLLFSLSPSLYQNKITGFHLIMVDTHIRITLSLWRNLFISLIMSS